jgi:hypothetical protein
MFGASSKRNKKPLKGLSLREVLARVSSVEALSGLAARKPSQSAADDAAYASEMERAYSDPNHHSQNARPSQGHALGDAQQQASGGNWEARPLWPQSPPNPSGFEQPFFGAGPHGTSFGPAKMHPQASPAFPTSQRDGSHYQQSATDPYQQDSRDQMNYGGDGSRHDPRYARTSHGEHAEPPEYRQPSGRRIVKFFAAGAGIGLAIAATFAIVKFRPLLPAALGGAPREMQASETAETPRLIPRVQAPVAASLEPSQQAAVATPMPAANVKSAAAMVPAVSIAPLPTQPTARMRIPDLIAAAGAQDISFPIELDAAGSAIDSLKVVITGLPVAARMSQGTRAANGAWTVDATRLTDLKLTMPQGTSREQLTVMLVNGAGVQLARLHPTIDIRPESDLKASLGKNDIEDRASSLLEQGKARIADGDVIGARMLFKKGADAGDARAAMAMGATFDPNLFASLQVQGMVPDVKAARQWYERAINLGSKDAHDRLDKLNSK